jgi:hypothetical protein
LNEENISTEKTETISRTTEGFVSLLSKIHRPLDLFFSLMVYENRRKLILFFCWKIEQSSLLVKQTNFQTLSKHTHTHTHTHIQKLTQKTKKKTN